MNLYSEPIGQHDLPKTYLKRFSINPNDRKLKSMVFCHWANEFETKIVPTSIDSKKFKKDNFYTLDNEKQPYIFETTFRDVIEPIYNKIMFEIENESNLSTECRQNIIVWLYFNKYRNKANRDNIERLVNFLIKTPYSMEYGKKNFELIKEETQRYAKHKSKEFQLKSLLQEDLMLEFEKGMGTKHWIILKSKSENPFLTSDNPGFSINIDMAEADMKSLNSFYAINHNASNYFILSPKYCLLISPFWQGTPLDISIHNQKIEFKTTNERHIDFINICTCATKTNYLISNKKEQLERFVKKMNR